ncbi:uncharacterized protein LOC142548514 isoform X1 [Primulina tabacum]|uniref:uncharacterized protein LOC142548514 isoform X1 n=1 Tax=Primulina tabacum TaxID=48773 RepID=UPI003F5944BE
MDHRYGTGVRTSEANGYAVCSRSGRLKSGNGGRIGYFDNVLECPGISSNAAEVVRSDCEIIARCGDFVNVGGVEDKLGDMSGSEVKRKPMGVVMRDGHRRFTRSVLRSKVEDSKMENGVDFEVDGSEGATVAAQGSPAKKMKMSKNILIKGRPTTVRELLDTGSLEGYPVFYNGGKKGFPLRGTIKDGGIICSCSLCKGVTVVPPCKFEIHACNSYRRASQYICLENGKSLLDIVKECRKASVNVLEETIQNFISPMPKKESFICHNCKKTFLATSSAKAEQLCDACMIIVSSDAVAECVHSGLSGPVLSSTISENTEGHNTPQSGSHRGRKKRKNYELASDSKSSGRSSPPVSTKKGKGEITNRRSRSSSASKCRVSASVRYTRSVSYVNTDGCASSHGLLKNKNSGRLSKSSETGSPSISLQSKSSWKITKKDQRMHWLVFEDGGLPDGTEVAYYSHGKKLQDGYKMGSGIVCRCCNTEVSPSQFEAHAGWASRRKPYMYIYTSNGVSLHEFAISLLKGRNGSAKNNDDLCIICADGGKLVLCDGCPRAFHKECASLSCIPRGKWYCTYCQNMFQRERFVESNANAVAAGRVLGIDAIEQIKSRCIRIVNSPEATELLACVICRGYDFSKSGFGPRTVILCDQCEKEYHVGCLEKCKMSDLKELPKGKWFCSVNCKRIYSALQNLLNNGAEKLPGATLDVVMKKWEGKNLVADTDLDVRWRLLNGKNTSRETRVLLSQAVAIFHECFDPIVDSETGRDFIPSMVYGRNIRGQNFSGMHCAILTVNSAVVSVGILRIFGQEMAELPLAATCVGYQDRGYFQILYTCIEKLLAFLSVKLLVLPAADEAKSIWTKKFGFTAITEEQLLNYKKTCWQMITFKGTSMLEKQVPKCRIINQDKSDSMPPSSDEQSKAISPQ